MFTKYRFFPLLILVIFVAACSAVMGTRTSSPFMRPAEGMLTPVDGKALVRFIRPHGGGWNLSADILDGEKVIGNITDKSMFDYLADPGKHLFISYSYEYRGMYTLEPYFLEAELDAGKTYYVTILIKSKNFFNDWAALTPVKRGTELWTEVNNYEKTFKILEPDQDLMKGWEGENKDYILGTIISSYEGKWKNERDWPELLPEDGR